MNKRLKISMACFYIFSFVFFHVSLSYCAGIPIKLDNIIIYQSVGETLYVDDHNENGIPDDQEVRDDVDLDQNDICDHDQDDLKTFKSPLDNSLMGIKGADGVKDIKVASFLKTSDIEGREGKPDFLNDEMIYFEVTCEKPGAIVFVTLLFEKPVPENADWIKYNETDGWYDYSAHTEISEDRKSVTLELEDGGFGDADKQVNGLILDPIGYTVSREKESEGSTDSALSASVSSSEPSDTSGSGGCFINTAIGY